MTDKLRQLPLAERLNLVEDLWDSIAVEEGILSLTPGQKAALDRRLDAYIVRRSGGRPATAADIQRIKPPGD